MKLKKADDKNEDKKQIPLTIKKQTINKYNESYEDTLNNIHALAVFAVKMFGRLGYQIKVMEEMKAELQKLTKLVENQ